MIHLPKDLILSNKQNSMYMKLYSLDLHKIIKKATEIFFFERWEKDAEEALFPINVLFKASETKYRS